MSEQPKRETPDEWAARMIREHGPVPMRIRRRLDHLYAQQAKKAQATQTGH